MSVDYDMKETYCFACECGEGFIDCQDVNGNLIECSTIEEAKERLPEVEKEQGETVYIMKHTIQVVWRRRVVDEVVDLLIATDMVAWDISRDFISAFVVERGISLTLTESIEVANSMGMRCPLCRTRLRLGPGMKEYETLLDHVEQPNADPPPRQYYLCPNTDCEIWKNNGSDAFWDSEGTYYSRCTSDKMEFYQKYRRDTLIPSSWDNPGVNALNSVMRKQMTDRIQEEKEKRKK